MDNKLEAGFPTLVVDGDTFHWRGIDGSDIVRLADVDTPERGKPGYGQATRFLRFRLTNLGVNRVLYREVVARDTYGRAVCKVWQERSDEKGNIVQEYINDVVAAFIRRNKASWSRPSYSPASYQVFAPGAHRRNPAWERLLEGIQAMSRPATLGIDPWLGTAAGRHAPPAFPFEALLGGSVPPPRPLDSWSSPASG